MNVAGRALGEIWDGDCMKWCSKLSYGIISWRSSLVSYGVTRYFCFAEQESLKNGIVEGMGRYCMRCLKVGESGDELLGDGDGGRMG